jgi:Flp pilus assembly protein TadB
MVALRLGYAVAVLAMVVWLLRSGRPLGGLLLVPLLAIWIRQSAESGRLTRFARRVTRTS